jgi:hypothetical protein
MDSRTITGAITPMSSSPLCAGEKSMATSDNKEFLSALEANWQAEIEGCNTYTALSKAEAHPQGRNGNGREASC